MRAVDPVRQSFVPPVRIRHVVPLLAAVSLFLLVFAAPALALTAGSRAATFGTVDCAVRLASNDPTGTVSLLRDGRVWAHLPASSGRTVTFRKVTLKGVGFHTLAAVLTTGAVSVKSNALRVRVWAWPKRPMLVGVDPTKLTGRKARIRLGVSADVTYADVFINGRYLRRIKVRPKAVNDLGLFAMPAATNSIGIRLGNPAGYLPTTTTWKLGRVVYPTAWATCIIVVKSKLRLLWIRNDVLVKSYTVATGRPSLPTPSAIWRVGIKHLHPGDSASGPRKLRLFRFRGRHWVYTAYGIHGTNVDASIGTYASHGCIRMHNRDILELFPQVPLWTYVQTR